MTLRSCTNAHIVGSTLLGALILAQTLCGKFSYWMDHEGHKAGDLTSTFYVSWGWWAICFLPLFLYFARNGGRGRQAPKVDWVAFVATLCFQLIPMLTILSEPFSNSFQRELLIRSLLWVVPAMTIALAMIHSSVKHEN